MQPENEEAGKAVATAIPSPECAFNRNHSCKPTRDEEQALDEILTCWRWARSLDHRLGVYRLQFAHNVAGALNTDHNALAAEIGSFKNVTQALGV